MKVSHQCTYRKESWLLKLPYRLVVGDKFHPALLANMGVGSEDLWNYIDKWCIVAFVVREVWILPDGYDLHIKLTTNRDHAKYMSNG